MKKILVHMWGVVVLVFFVVAGNARGEEGKQIPLDSLLGRYEGVLQVHMFKTLERDYQAEIVSVDSVAKTLSLVAHCSNCEVREWKRNHCRITEAKEDIKFTCKGAVSDEEYTFKNDTLKVSGQGKKWPYSISAKKVAK